MNYVKQLTEAQELIGLYKAEWLSTKLFDYFNEPGYFSELKKSRPCVLIGGRGTGKTTVLKGLSYEGQYALKMQKGRKFESSALEFYGLYYRVNTNRVSAFKGSEISPDKWISYFGHYINLSFCFELLKFALWFEKHTEESINITEQNWKKILRALHITDDIRNLEELSEELEIIIIEFEASINQAIDEPPKNITMCGAPIDILSQSLTSDTALKNKQFFFLIDEFENFEDYQQKIVNTLIKHNNDYYTFKIGVRELGFRERSTLNDNEQLTSPADYVKINLTEVFVTKDFKGFAELVVNARLNHSIIDDEKLNIVDILKPLSNLEEAELLLGSNNSVESDFNANLNDREIKSALDISLGHKYFIHYWSKKKRESVSSLLDEWLTDKSKWENRLNNHFYASLFGIREGKTGIRKYYCGWDTLLALANGNIRYLLELVDTVLKDYLEECKNKEEVNEYPIISPAIQTYAAVKVGKKNLSELEGLSVEGAKLTKLLLSLGRIFGVLASKPLNQTPEANQFQIRFKAEDEESINKIIRQAIMHLALIRHSGNKLTEENSTKDYDYMIHPIFSAFFVFSYRKKRKITLNSNDLLSLVYRPHEGIKKVLESNRSQEPSLDLPDQMQLFEGYYE
ncbi:MULTISPECIES: hypothetical protein [Psychrobacter]|jgi:hypothetical protein|uniref:ORC-CDC6 family AAA ATPase n=1 Tax=Psychrobacter TaxID=497 RepID=UPI001BB00D6B|nr:hypothetical protein [Psychrobacter sp. UBA2514]|tara:strand:+ start:2289 stop:4172 length:1884 start_codon:yes stop_codon:yes gene_type:complete